MSSPMYKLERRRELESVLALRRGEVALLREQKVRLLSELMQRHRAETRNGATEEGNTTNGTDTGTCMGSQINPLDLPILQLCDDSRRTFRTSDLMAMEAGIDSLAHYTSILKKGIESREAQLKEVNESEAELQRRIDEVVTLTGVTENEAASATPAAAFTSETYAEKAKRLADLRHRVNKVHQEVRMAALVIPKKVKAIEELQATIDKRVEVVENTHACYNELRVLNRSIAERKEELKAMLEKHEAVDRALDQLTERRPGAILDREASMIRSEVKALQLNDRRTQERVAKAQEFRLDALRKRLNTIRKCLEHQRLEGIVDQILTAYHSESDSVSQAGMLVRVDREELYDIDAILPANERIHGSIHRLLHDERRAQAKTVSTMRLMLRERDDAIDALAAKVTAMVETYEASIRELERTTIDAQGIVGAQRRSVHHVLVEHKATFQALIQQKVHLKRQLRRLKEEFRALRGSTEAPLETPRSERRGIVMSF